MKPSPFLALPMSVVALIHPQQASSHCCFNVVRNDTFGGPLRETQTGDLVLGGASEPVTLCIDESAGTVTDLHGHECSMEEPEYQFKCRSGALAPSNFGLEHRSDTSNGLLTYDGGNAAFIACSTEPSDNNGHTIYSSLKVAASDCLEVALLAVDQTSGCFAPRDQPVSAPAVIRTTTKTTIIGTASTPSANTHQIQGSQNTSTSKVVANATFFSSSTTATPIPSSMANTTALDASKTTPAPSSTSSTSTIASASCSVADSAPSIAPVQIGYPTQDVQDTQFVRPGRGKDVCVTVQATNLQHFAGGLSMLRLQWLGTRDVIRLRHGLLSD
ncbi:hypothetical protein PG996_002117 [Apiospora saccharicola]|uniref:Cyanovirin-N domain-containing protein n=1 Tax=Apiospora saccharicola TaxID=335842 RepID=A0ABR1WIJ4_9PEZI